MTWWTVNTAQTSAEPGTQRARHWWFPKSKSTGSDTPQARGHLMPSRLCFWASAAMGRSQSVLDIWDAHWHDKRTSGVNEIIWCQQKRDVDMLTMQWQICPTTLDQSQRACWAAKRCKKKTVLATGQPRKPLWLVPHHPVMTVVTPPHIFFWWRRNDNAVSDFQWTPCVTGSACECCALMIHQWSQCCSTLVPVVGHLCMSAVTGCSSERNGGLKC